MTIALVLAVLSLLPKKSVAAPGACGHLDPICLMDAHPGVVAFLTLVIALTAGLIAYLSLYGDAAVTARALDLKHEEADRLKARYNTLVLETLYECVHHLRHLTDAISWRPPVDPATNEYAGCVLTDWPVLNFRYADRLLDVPYVQTLEQDAPAVLGFLDHALRNARYIEQSVNSSAPAALAERVVWMSEHLLRVLICLRYRSLTDPAAENSVAGIAKRVLVAADLDDLLDPDMGVTRSQTPIATEIELRDRVRFVRHAEGRDGRKLDSSVAFFAPEGEATQLLEELKGMDDPPPRPKKPPSVFSA